MRANNILLTIAAGACIAAGVIHFSAASRNAAPRSVDSHVRAFSNSASASSKMAAPPAPAEPDVQATAEAILAADPEDSNGRYAALLDELCRSGQFHTAVNLAGKAGADLQTTLLKIIFNRWAQTRPLDALKSLDAITDPQLHSVALRAAADGWNTTSPGDLAAYAFALPPGDDRGYALGIALDNWSLQDPAALADWLNTLPRGAEFDSGVALMLQKTDGANRSPEVAMQWVENISDPALKQDSLMRVLDEWMQSDSAAAKQYLASAAWLDDSQRQQILEKTSPARSQNDE